jgi:Rap1a immunity proteins
MRRWVSLVGVCVALLASSAANAQSGKQMLQACQLLERGMHAEGSTLFLPPGMDIRECWGFMEAVQQYAILADHEGKPLLGACPKPDTTTTSIVRVFVSYALAHPEKLQLPAAAVAYNAMADAFPCK